MPTNGQAVAQILTTYLGRRPTPNDIVLAGTLLTAFAPDLRPDEEYSGPEVSALVATALVSSRSRS